MRCTTCRSRSCATGTRSSRIRYVGVCDDDISLYKGDNRSWPLPKSIVGHEFSGEIEDLGELAYHAGFRIGDAVSGYAWNFCGACRYCKSGLEAHCSNAACISVLAELVVLNMRQIQKLRPGVPLEHGIFTDAIGYCLYNGGLTAAFICLILMPTAEELLPTRKQRRLRKAEKAAKK